MGELDAFTVDPGIDAGRIKPDVGNVGIRVVGDYVFCLGHDRPGFKAWILPNDYVQIAQTFEATAPFLTFAPRTRPPREALPVGFHWEASVLIDGVVVSVRKLEGKGPTDWITWTVDVIALMGDGDHDIGFRLSLRADDVVTDPFLELEIPAFYIDGVELATLAPVAVRNCVPDATAGAPAFVPVDASSFIDFDVYSYPASGAVSVDVVIDGDIAIIGGAIQTGFEGSVTSIAHGVHAHVRPVVPFESGATVAVSVEASTLTESGTGAWTFHVRDTVAPTLSGVVARAPRTLRVTWSEDVVASSPTGEGDALDPERYVLAPILDGDAPAVTPTAIAVASVDGSSRIFDVTTDIELTSAAPYTLSAINVADAEGNAIVNALDFFAFELPRPTRRRFDLYRALPLANRQADVTKDLRRFIACLQEVTDLVLYGIDEWTSILDVDTASEPFLDAMLADLGNPFPFVLEEADKRRLLLVLVDMYRQKGTGPGIISVVRFFLGLTVTIETFIGDSDMQLGIALLGVNWILGPGDSRALYSFRVVSAIALTDEQRKKVSAIANYMKPAHTHMVEVREPETPVIIDHISLGESRLGVNWLLH